MTTKLEFSGPKLVPLENLVSECVLVFGKRQGESNRIARGVAGELRGDHHLSFERRSPAWPTNDDPDEGDLDGRFGEFFVGSSSAAAVSGYADITVPAAYIEGLPVGITFIGGRWAEPELIGFAYDFEQATDVRVPPQFVPTIGDDLFPGLPSSAVRAKRHETQGQRALVVRLR